MTTPNRIERFYQDIQGLDVKYPVSAISAATGETKGNVSKYLNRKMTPSESFLNRFYMKFGKVVQQNAPTKPQEAQNGAQNPKDSTLTKIGVLIKEIQYKTNPTLSIEDIGKRIGYGRTQLTNLTKKGHSKKAYALLQKEFSDILDMTTSTKQPVFEVNSNGKEKDAVTKAMDVVKTIAETNHSQQQTISKLTDLVSKLVSK